jgi:hypothetical protein
MKPGSKPQTVYLQKKRCRSRHAYALTQKWQGGQGKRHGTVIPNLLSQTVQCGPEKLPIYMGLVG